jgi:hypothetical protein
MATYTDTLSTSTPASEISSSSFNDGEYSDSNNAPSLDDIMKNSPVAELLGLNSDLPEEDESENVQDKTTEDSTDEDVAESEKESDEEADKDKADEKEAGDEESTPESELPGEDDIDWTYKIPVKIDGELKYVTLEEARKGYATDQHLTSKGRQLAEEKKAIDTERTTKLNELVQLGTVLHEDLMAEETKLTADYQRLTAEIDKARDEGDTYAAREAKDAREAIQEKYWKVRNGREEKTKAIASKIQEQQTLVQQELLKQYSEKITTLIPDYSDKVAKSVREFAIKEGIPEGLLEQIYDPQVVKFINDYRKLKTAKDTGEAKRKIVQTVKSIPTKKGTPISQREQAQDKSSRAKVLSGQGSNQDQLDFLKRISSVSKKL